MNEKIRVLLCDDHALLRSGLRALLSTESDIEVVGEVGTGEEALEKASELKPDVVLMDVSLPGIDGLEATRQILTRLPDCRVLVLTMHRQMHYLLGALRVGASGYVLKSDLDRELVRAIRAAHEGEAFVYSTDTTVFFQAYLEQGGRLESGQRLSAMEERVLKYTAQGQTSREIAEQLNISPSTVDTYRSRIMSKLGVRRRAELVQWAVQHGLFTPE